MTLALEEFNATDALRCVNNYQCMLKVACAEEWQERRTEGEHSKEVIKPCDWTYTTDYKESLLGESLKLKVVPTTDHIDTETLKDREQIKFFEEVLPFEDELHDHRVSSRSVKIRVMPSSFFSATAVFPQEKKLMGRSSERMTQGFTVRLTRPTCYDDIHPERAKLLI